MQVQVKHNGTAITGYVVSYNREHKICTGIGTLTVEVDRAIPRTFNPWDEIDIWENGSFKVKYYVSSVQDTEPKGVLILECQDISKRLVDYFIPDSYTVDYPSYTRYWIEKFLTEAGVSYQFTTSSQGTLLSNFTQLGLVTTYEQLQTLLQMSGWYMYFSGDEKAVIGTLDINTVVGSYVVGKRDILDIMKSSNDKMLRNRALVLGAYDPYRGGYASADVTVHTPWNYDHRDVRAVVISNSNIPNQGTAYGMANQIIKEFAKITVEKHITLWGARNYNLGRAMRVSSNVWRGRGLITTFGVEMSKDGLVTHVVLDERCPRLFGYFDWGDYVYVGTFGDGVWRKHIKFDHTWSNFSTGLTNLNITDLHINNGVFGAVASSGQAYYAIDELPWHPIAMSGFMSSLQSTVSSGAVTMVGFSGAMARAVIVDKMGNVVRYGVDNASGINYGDYALNVSGWMHSVSGVMGSGTRGWIVEYDVLNGDTTGTAFPISLSGVYNFAVLDLDNDGKNDFVSVATIGSGGGIPNVGDNYNFGHMYSQPFAASIDPNNYSINPSLVGYVNDNVDSSEGGQLRVANPNCLVSIDDGISNLRRIIAYGKDGIFRKITLTRTLVGGVYQTSQSSQSSVANTAPTAGHVLGIYPDWSGNTYKVFYQNTSNTPGYFVVTWNANSNTWSSVTTLGTITPPHTIAAWTSKFIVVNNKIYALFYGCSNPGTSGGHFRAASHFHAYVTTIDIVLDTITIDHVFQFDTTQDTDPLSNSVYYHFPSTSLTSSESLGVLARQVMGIFQNGTGGVQIIGWLQIHSFYTPNSYNHSQEYVLSGDATTIQSSLLYDNATARFGSSSGSTNAGCQLSDEKGFIGRTGTSGNLSFVWNGTTFFTYTSTGTAPYYHDPLKIYPVFSNQNDYYISLNGTTFELCSAASMTAGTTITPPTGYTLSKPYSNAIGTFGSQIYWSARRTSDFVRGFLPYSFGSFDTANFITPAFNSTSPRRGTNYGGFFISDGTYTDTQPQSEWIYVDMGVPVWNGIEYLILKRDGDQFTLIERESYPMRVDISNNAPVLTVGSGEGSFVSNYVYESELVVIEQATASGGRTVEDYRYTYLEPTLNNTVTSGAAALTTILYVSGSGVYGADALTYSGGFSQVYAVPSGYGKRIETSNYGVGGQYVFVTSSGYVQTFYQKDPGQVSFVAYSGMPQSRATIIRLDDAV